jgi:hypothetical protein
MGATKFLQRLRTEEPRVTQLLKAGQMKPESRSLDLSSFLLQPMQRVTRYPLLFRQILHYTPPEHPDHADVVAALAGSQQVADAVNAAARGAENRQKLADLLTLLDLHVQGEGEEGLLDLLAPTRELGERQFLLEGPLQKTKSGRRLVGYLFNDLLLLAEKNVAFAAGGPGKPWVIYRKVCELGACSLCVWGWAGCSGAVAR